MEKIRFYFISMRTLIYSLLSILIVSSLISWGLNSQPVTTSQLQKTIVIDAGHGGIDPGTHKEGVLEKDINLAIAHKLVQKLDKGNIKLIMTRKEDKLYQDDRNKDIIQRAKIANQQEVDLLVSIHVNSFPSANSFGGQTFYAAEDKESKKLAAAIQEQLIKIQPDNYRQIKTGSYYLLRKTDIPAVIVEVGFISNPQDRKRINDPQEQAKIAQAIAQGIINYLNDNL
ncbi:N-acetylmuramoyl-L-alanine amidase family protein [Halanaerobaculum tunisiense]